MISCWNSFRASPCSRGWIQLRSCCSVVVFVPPWWPRAQPSGDTAAYSVVWWRLWGTRVSSGRDLLDLYVVWETELHLSFYLSLWCTCISWLIFFSQMEDFCFDFLVLASSGHPWFAAWGGCCLILNESGILGACVPLMCCSLDWRSPTTSVLGSTLERVTSGFLYFSIDRLVPKSKGIYSNLEVILLIQLPSYLNIGIWADQLFAHNLVWSPCLIDPLIETAILIF